MIQLLQVLLGEDAVMGDLLNLQQAPVRLKPDHSQFVEIAQALSDVEVTRIVDRGLGPQRLAFFVVLLDARTFVVDVQRWNDTVGDHAGAERPRRSLCYPSVENELYLFGATDIEVLANDLFEEDAAADSPVQHLSE